ncbi:MAG: hypothetical protein MMC23_003566 [Stictis urceolatum]|nr:hypothetical protein [Stictis urceolata]
MHEAANRRVVLEHDPLEAVTRMLSFFYKKAYDPTIHGGIISEILGQDQPEIYAKGHELFLKEPSAIVDPNDKDLVAYKEEIERIARREKMSVDVRVYALADKYDIPSLKALAVHRIGVLASPEHAFRESADLVDLGRLIYSVTAPSDQDLRGAFAAMSSRESNRVLEKRDFRTMFKEEADMTLSILDRTSQELETLRKKAESLRQWKSWALQTFAFHGIKI